jgi:phage-related protein (TIGR01555 family)
MASKANDSGPSPRMTADGITNVVTGLGTLRDPRVHNAYYSRCFTDREIYQAYAGSWLMTKIVNKPATEMVRAWRDWQADDDQIAAIEKYERRLNIRAKVRQAEVLRGLGGCGMVLWIGNEDPALPVNPRTLIAGSLRGIHVWHRSRFTLEDMETDPTSDWYGQPKFYRVASRDGRQLRIHPSRVIAFKAQEIPDIVGVAWKDAFWGLSQVQIVMDAVQNSDTAQNSFAAMFKDARNRRIGIPGMTNMIATADGEKILQARMAAVAALESMLGVTFYDSGEDGKNGEAIDDRQMTWSGIPEINNNYLAMCAAAADMPATILLGKSPDGMNATGQGDTEAWEKTVKARQDLDLRPCLDQLDAILIPSATGAADEEIYFDFAPLSVPNEKDEATTFKTTVEAITELQATGTIPEIALSKGVQNLMTERGWIPGLDGALGEIPEAERFPDGEPDLADDPAAGQFDPVTGKPVAPAAQKRWPAAER